MGWLFAAFAVVWLAFFAYLYNLHRKQRAIAEEIAALNKRLSAKDHG